MQKNVQKHPVKSVKTRPKKIVKADPVQEIEAPKVVQKKRKLTKNRDNLNPMQTKAIKKLTEQAEKGGKIVLGRAVKDAGYGEEVQRNPKKVFGKPAVIRKLKDLKVDPEGIRDIHERLMNSKKLEVLQYSILIPEEDIVFAITSNIKGSSFLKSTAYPEWGSRHYQFMMPNESSLIKALEFAYKLFPPVQQQDPKMQEKFSQKRVDKLNELAKNLKLKKPLKLGKTP